MKKIVIAVILVCLLSFCKDDNIDEPVNCEDNVSLEVIGSRSFNMGFSTWSYGPSQSDVDDTYQFISTNADVYSEQIDDKIPWDALINDTDYPAEFINDIASRVSNKFTNHKLLLSVSLLDALRNGIAEDFDGTIPEYDTLNDIVIEESYSKYLKYLIDQFQPDYLVIAMEVNELLMKSESKWNEYKLLMQNVRSSLKQDYPNLLLSESITLHNWFEPEVSNSAEYIDELTNYIKQLDFAAISFYPFFKDLHSVDDFQQVFNFLHEKVGKPIAFVETTQIAENLSIASYNLNIVASECEQKDYLEVLLLNAYTHDYEFIIWWSHRDYDKLVQSFPEDLRDVGRLWQNSGLLDEDGNKRPAYYVWNTIFNK